MLSKFCPDCDVLLAKLHSAITEADAIIEEAAELIHASTPPNHAEEWLGSGGRTPTEKSVVAAMNLKNHFATKHPSTPSSQEHGQG
jgi:hypothetical protein